jgi:hypothetical protein
MPGRMLAALVAALALAAPSAGQITDHSVRLTWTTPAPAPTAVEYGTTTGYGLYASVPGSGTSHVLTLTNLAAATTYHVHPLAGDDLQVTTSPPAAVPHTLTIGPRRALLLDGRPFVPIMQWLQCPSLFDENRALGIDVFLGRGCQNSDADEVAQTAQRGAFSILPFDTGVAAAPGLLAWRVDDEPDQNNVPVAAVAQATARGHAQTPRRLTFGTITSAFFGPTHKDVPSAAYARALDVVGFDIYPVYGYCRPDLIAWEADATRALVRISRPGEPVYSWIEAASTSSQWCHGRGVLPQELRAETWMALVDGATAVGFFTHSWTPDYAQFRVSAAVQTEIKRTARQVTTLAPALLGRPVHVGVQTSVGRVDAIARAYDGALYVFAVNVSRTPVTARFTGVANGAWHAYEEGRSVTATGGSFPDAFAPLGVHVYVLPPAAFR